MVVYSQTNLAGKMLKVYIHLNLESRGGFMDRRTFLWQALATTVATGIATRASAANYFPASVDQALFEGINRVKDQTKKTGLEKGHAPVINAPGSVKSGEPFTVEVTVGENLHPMGPSHWIEYIELNIGNEPAGR